MGAQRVHEAEGMPRRTRRKAASRAEQPSGVMALQRSAGNAAVAQALSVQRTPAKKGDELGGVGARFAVEQYVGVARKLEQNWGRLTPYGRAQMLVTALNFELAHIDVPAVDLPPLGGAGGNAGEFDAEHWAMNLDPDKFKQKAPVTDDHAASVAATVYHEGRHAEQDFLVARMLAGKNLKPAEIAEAYELDLRIATIAAKRPLKGAGADEKKAERIYESEKGAGSDARNATLKELAEARERLEAANIARQWAPEGKEDDAEAKFAVAQAAYDEARARYKALPEEADAWKVGDAVKDAYSNGKKP